MKKTQCVVLTSCDSEGMRDYLRSHGTPDRATLARYEREHGAEAVRDRRRTPPVHGLELYNVLPPPTLRRCDDPRRRQSILRPVLAGARSDERALDAFVAAVYGTSASVNLYSVMLVKKRVHVERLGAHEEEIEKLTEYLFQELGVPAGVPSTGAA